MKLIEQDDQNSLVSAFYVPFYVPFFLSSFFFLLSNNFSRDSSETKNSMIQSSLKKIIIFSIDAIQKS
jgi:hypothetical protein